MPVLSDEARAGSGPVRPKWMVVALAAISIGAGILMLSYGAVARIEYDGWWHVFIARVSDWPMFWREVYTNAHPPLFFLLLKVATFLFGLGHLAYRSVSIASGVISVVLVGLIVEKLVRDRFTVVVSTLAFATSTVTVIMANEVRSYMLAGAFFLFSLYFYIDIVQPKILKLRTYFLCSFGLIFGILSHYSMLFVVPIFLIIPFLIFVGCPDFRKRIIPIWRRYSFAHLLMLSLPIVVGFEEYFCHIRTFAGATKFGYLSRFFYDSGETIPVYIGRVLFSEIDLFSPVDLLSKHRSIQISVVVVLVVGFLWLLSSLRKSGETEAIVIPLTAMLLVGELLVISIAGMYPFGGPLRHQYIVFPVMLITFFMVVDRFFRFLRENKWRKITQGGFVAIIAVLTIHQWREFKIPVSKLSSNPIMVFRDEFPGFENVIADQFSFIHFFSHEHDAEWKFVESYRRGRSDRFRVENGGRGFDVYRHRKWQAHVDAPANLRQIRRTMKSSGSRRMVVFHLERYRRGEAPPRKARKEGDPVRLKDRGRRNGLTVDKVVRGRRLVFVEVELAEE